MNIALNLFRTIQYEAISLNFYIYSQWLFVAAVLALVLKLLEDLLRLDAVSLLALCSLSIILWGSFQFMLGSPGALNLISTAALPTLSVVQIMAYQIPRALPCPGRLPAALSAFLWLLAYLLNQPRRISALLYGSTMEEMSLVIPVGSLSTSGILRR